MLTTVSAIFCPCCGVPLLERQLGVVFAKDLKVTVLCKDHFGNGCGNSFDIIIDDEPILEEQSVGGVKGFFGYKKSVEIGRKLVAKVIKR